MVAVTDRWLGAALDYVDDWLGFQMRVTEQPGCSIAVAHRGHLVFERAYGYADAVRGRELTPRHRFRVASHSKTFTAAGILKLRERKALQLDDPVGRYVPGLHRAIAPVTLSQLLSHSAGITRDGPDTGQWTDRRPFRSTREILRDLAVAPPIDANTRFKCSNHGYGLLGLVIEAVSGEAYRGWIQREVVDAAGLEETRPDVPLPRGARLARGHSARLPLGRRVVVPGDNSTEGLAAATGFVSTAADLARFFHQLSPDARRSVLSVASRREMTRPQWRVPHSAVELSYGLGTVSGAIGGWRHFGHTGGFQGTLSRTAVFPAQDLAVSVLTNAVDGMARQFLDGAVYVLRHFAARGAPSRRTAPWRGRWWSLWGCVDLVPVGDRVMVASPAQIDPFIEASEIEVTARDAGRIALAGGFASHGEAVSLVRRRRGGRVTGVVMAGAHLRDEGRLARELEARYGRD